MPESRLASMATHRWRREPLLHFLLIGLVLFAVSALRDRGADAPERAGRIEVTEADLRQIALGWIAQGRGAPSPDELRSLADARVREEILSREARALGLDEDDTIVRRRLAQKMEFLFEDVAQLREPADDELAAWFAANADRFALPARITFRHLYFSPDRRGPQTRADAARALARVAGLSADAPEAIRLGDPFMFQAYYGDRSADDVAKTFGPSFTRAVFQAPPGRWAGPIDSGYGAHLVWVDSVIPPRVPSFAEVAAEARAAWIEARRAEIREQAFAAMRARYEVVLPEGLAAADLASLPPAGAAGAERTR